MAGQGFLPFSIPFGTASKNPGSCYKFFSPWGTGIWEETPSSRGETGSGGSYPETESPGLGRAAMTWAMTLAQSPRAG